MIARIARSAAGGVAEPDGARHLVVQRDRLGVRASPASCRGGCARRAPPRPRRRAPAASRCRWPRAASGGRRCRRAGRRRGRPSRPCTTMSETAAARIRHWWRRGPLGGQRGGHRLEAAAQLGEREQLLGAVAHVEAPADQPRVEDVPAAAAGWMVMPTRRREATMPIDSSTRIASRATLRDTAYSGPMAVQGQHLPDGQRADDDPPAEGVEDAGVLARRRPVGRGSRHGASSHLGDVRRKIRSILLEGLAKIMID